ncbi:MAG: hypothetical protein KA998_04520 [Rickettsiaceae bacterium]|nr:hypothetical protein [Rickettsiaceae bacterium]
MNDIKIILLCDSDSHDKLFSVIKRGLKIVLKKEDKKFGERCACRKQKIQAGMHHAHMFNILGNSYRIKKVNKIESETKMG